MENPPIHFRNVTLDDAANLLAFFNELDLTADYMLLEPNERKTTLAQQKEIIAGLGKTREMIIALSNNHIVGFIVISKGIFIRNAHLGSIVVGVKQNFRNKGVAKSLISQAIDWCKNNQISQLELTVAVSNLPAIKCYLSVGFVISGVRERALKIKGYYIDEYYMTKAISV